ncbi:MAG TPA: PAS domain S-box protein [Herpetosiphonaceae bacterium]
MNQAADDPDGSGGPPARSDDALAEAARGELEGVLDRIRDQFLVLDAEWRCVVANDQVLAANQLRREQLLGRSLWELFPATAGTAFERELRRAAAEQLPVHFEFFYQPTGRWFSNHAYPSPAGLTLLAADITAHKESEARLRESEERFRAMADSAPVMIWVTEADGRCVYLSKSWYQFTGQTAETGLGFGWLAAIHPAERAGAELAFLDASARAAEFRLEYRLRRADGAYRWFIDSASPRLDDGGGFLGYIGSVIDITERREAEEAIRLSEERLRLALESADVGTWDFRPLTGRLTWDARCKQLFGLPPDAEIDYGVFLSGLHPDDRELTDQVVQAALDPATGGGYAIEYRTVGLRDGVERWIAANGQGFFDDAGQAVRFIGTVLDITERKRLDVGREQRLIQEQQLRAQAETVSRLKDEFLATVSHELRTPLTAFLGYAQMLQSRKRDEAYVARTVERMVRSAKTQAQLIEDLLDVARIASGKLRIEPRPIDLSVVIRSALDTVSPAIEARGQLLDVALDPAAVAVVGDPGRLEQVIWNLLSNATKFTPPGGAISLRLERRGGEAWLTVSDSGQGISPAFLPFVFDRFRQADGTSVRAHGGLGLGMAIVKHLAELHGGSVEAASPGEGLGATFTVRLPAQAAPPADQPRPAAEDECPPELIGLRVLVVDDQADLLELIDAILGDCGAEVRAVSGARQALEVVAAWRPAVLVCDLAMPGEDGYWLIERLRALPPEAGGALPAIALTAYVGVEERVRVLAAGFQFYVPKPIEPAELRDVVARLAAGGFE